MYTFLAIDTETATLEPRYAVEVGWAISSRGEVVKGYRALVAEVWENKPTKTGAQCVLTADTMLEGKFALYNSDLYAGSVKPLKQIAIDFFKDMAEYQPLIVSAHNAPFDRRALSTVFEAYGLQRLDISKRITHDTMLMCREILLPMAPSRAEQLKLTAPTPTPLQKIFAEWAAKDPSERMTAGAHSKPRISVENVWRFLTNNPGFVESHTAREDAEVEVRILEWLVRQYNH